jgi:hypothetical protein
MNGLAATAGAVRLKLRSDFTYRTPRAAIRTYVHPGGEIRKKKGEDERQRERERERERERKRETGVFSFPGRGLLNATRIRDITGRS